MYNILIQKLEVFIRKYYLNQLLRGGLYSSTILLSALIVWLVAEYLAHFGQGIRGVMFYGFVGLLLVTLTKWVALPLFKLYRLGVSTISYEDASRIIGNHFSEVQDKLLNVLQLKKELDVRGTNTELLLASMDQKIDQVQRLPFQVAVDLSANKKYIKYLLLPCVVLLLMSLIKPELVWEPTERIIHYNKAFLPKAPFEFIVNPNELKVAKNEMLDVKLKVEGGVLPAEVDLIMEGKVIGMIKEGKTRFHYHLNNLQESTSIQFMADGFYSKAYQIEVLPNPLLLNFSVQLDFPSYLGIENQELNNIGDLEVPEGTEVKWLFLTESTDQLTMRIGDVVTNTKQVDEERFMFAQVVKKNVRYSVSTSNAFMEGKEAIQYQLNVIRDAYPEIDVQKERDSVKMNVLHCIGEISDDYGLRGLWLNYRIEGKEMKNEKGTFKSVPIPFDRSQNKARFYYALDFSKLGLLEGEELAYYFEVADNDGVNGSKRSRTPIARQWMSSARDMQKEAEEQKEQIKEEIAKAIAASKTVRKELAELNKIMTEKKELTWQDKKRVEEVLQKQTALERSVKEIEKSFKQNKAFTEEFKVRPSEFREKQQLLEQLLSELMTEEMKRTMENIEELLEKMNKENLLNETEKMELSAEDLEKELDRTLELFKQMEVEEKLKEAIGKLEEIKKEQQELLDKPEKSRKGDGAEELSKQEKLNEKFENLKEDMEELREKNEQLEYPNEMKSTEEQEGEIANDMQESSKALEKQQSKKAEEMQQSAKEGMEKMSESLAMMQQSMQEKQGEDLNALRQLLDNIITSSFDQEKLMDEMEEISNDDPKYVEAMVSQKGIMDNIKIVEDSLFALSKRVPQLQSVVNKEINLINHNIDGAIKEMQERRTGQALTKQQLAMTSLNNLGLLLDEAVQQLQQQMASMMEGSGSCNKPGGKGKPKSASMSEMQKKLNEQLKSLQDASGKGGKPQGKEGSGEGSKGQKMGKELAEMAARQAALREELKKMAGKGQGGSEMGDGKKLSDLMEQTETDIVNKQITRETIARQEEILTRLLESEKAEREREWDNKRKSSEGKENEEIIQKRFLEYYKETQKEVELLRTMLPSYNEFYKKRVSEYFKALSE